jgi:hypothetical protein
MIHSGLTAHHTPTFSPCNGTSCIALGFSSLHIVSAHAQHFSQKADITSDSKSATVCHIICQSLLRGVDRRSTEMKFTTERVYCRIFCEEKTYKKCICKFRHKYPDSPVPTASCVSKLV